MKDEIYYKIFLMKSLKKLVKYRNFNKIKIKIPYNNIPKVNSKIFDKIGIDYLVDEKNSFVNIIVLSTENDLDKLLNNKKILLKFLNSGGKIIANEHLPFFAGFLKNIDLVFNADFNKKYSKFYNQKTVYSPRSESMINLDRFKPSNIKKYDLFFATWINNNLHKGWSYIEKSLDDFKEKNYSVCIVNYKYSNSQNKIIKKLKKYENISYYEKLSKKDFAKELSKSRIAVFTSILDCSPRIISQALASNVSVLVNKNIYGGQHLVSKDTGLLFNGIDDMLSKIKLLLKKPRSGGRKFLLKNCGYKNKSSILASNINELYGTNYKHLYFVLDKPFNEVNKKYYE